MRRNVIPFFAAALLLAADAPADDAAKKELEKFQGSWTATQIEEDGMKASEQDVIRTKLIFTGDKYAEKDGDAVVEEGTQKLDPTKKPKTMDITITLGQAKGNAQVAIYEIDGDTLKICAAAAGSKERPTDFTAKAGSGRILLVLKRDKAK